ncbi:MBOAT family O-acyltransferase [Algibacter mikhailovii]|uniref:O-acyltransferase n=1 Tax=Algibacter mikhailovii TaxID=425498 RepID=A0A918R1N5_9FLAO|nr:MBOAT family protein [Algibacter mikhailovii]GGZ81044.1 O-acyltransferase [Algibacter mikhailovii]
MLFNSLDFAWFLPLVFILYWFFANKNLKYQNFLIVVASYVFYGWWDWRFLFLIAFSTIVDYLIGRKLSTEGRLNKRKVLLYLSILVNLGLLGFFKYYNFFLDNFITAFKFFGKSLSINSLNIILPVGISFYTFQTLSYTIDVYKRKLTPTHNFIAFTAFVSFFPQLVAGPIERATNLLPQFYKKREFVYEKAVEGLRQILWGLFKKMVIADNCAVYANMIFNNSDDYSGSTLVLGAVFFSFQIYGDFSGYSDIAIGTSKLFGFRLIKNFSFPYFSRDIAEFWRRWHISLSTWFRDYLYIPLGGSKGSIYNKIRNVFIIFLVSGFWHGANWTFIFWGLLNALYFIPLMLFNKNRNHVESISSNVPSILECIKILITYGLVVFAWVFFRAENIQHAISYCIAIFDYNLFSLPPYSIRKLIYPTLFLLVLFNAIEWFGRKKDFAIAQLETVMGRPLRWVFYAMLIFLIGMYMQTEETPFIYFQF